MFDHFLVSSYVVSGLRDSFKELDSSRNVWERKIIDEDP